MKSRKVLFMVTAAALQGAIGALAGVPGLATGGEKLTVSISLNVLHYVIKSASQVLKMDMVGARMSSRHQLSFVQMPYADLQTAIQQKKADVFIGVQPTDAQRVLFARFDRLREFRHR